jgi:hypothetical protein
MQVRGTFPRIELDERIGGTRTHVRGWICGNQVRDLLGAQQSLGCIEHEQHRNRVHSNVDVRLVLGQALGKRRRVSSPGLERELWKHVERHHAHVFLRVLQQLVVSVLGNRQVCR